MKTLDNDTCAEIISSMVKQCRADIATFFRTGKDINKATDAIRFLFSDRFEWYMAIMGMPSQDYDLYRRVTIERSIDLADEKGNYAFK